LGSRTCLRSGRVGSHEKYKKPNVVNLVEKSEAFLDD
jgi:hypothetical protein